jgi:Lon-like ATP-dependent protease
VEGDSASITMATVILSAIEGIPIRQDMAMTGSLSVRGKVLPVGAVTAKLEAAAASGIKLALIPEANGNDVMIQNKYYHDMDIYTVENFRDVIEYAFVDCPKKTELMMKLLPLTEDGVSQAKKVEPPVEMRPAAKQEEKPEQTKAEPLSEESKEPVPIKKKKSSKDSIPAPQ